MSVALESARIGGNQIRTTNYTIEKERNGEDMATHSTVETVLIGSRMAQKSATTGLYIQIFSD